MTNAMKTIAYIMLVLGILGSIILGVMTKSFLTFIIYGIGSFILCLQWLVLVEISEKIDSLSEQISRTERQLTHTVSSQGDNQPSNSRARLLPPPVSNSGNTWTCPKCKKTNPNSQRVCKDCGYIK